MKNKIAKRTKKELLMSTDFRVMMLILLFGAAIMFNKTFTAENVALVLGIFFIDKMYYFARDLN